MTPLPYPPVLTGSAEEQLRQLWDYVYQLAERLNLVVSGVGDDAHIVPPLTK